MRILFLAGPHAVGKSYFMNEIARKNNFFQFDTGPQMRKMHKNYAPNISIGEWVDSLEQQYGPLITCDMLCKVFESEYDGNENVIITGFRQIEGIEYMIDYFKPEKFQILYIDGTYDLLKNNYIFREKKEITDNEFKKYLSDEEEWGLKKLRDYVINNPENCKYVMKSCNLDKVETDIFEKEKVLVLNINDKKED